jgi:hypothetical protein
MIASSAHGRRLPHIRRHHAVERVIPDLDDAAQGLAHAPRRELIERALHRLDQILHRQDNAYIVLR